MKKKIIGIGFLIILIAAGSGYYYAMHGGARNLATEEAVFTVTSQSIATEFTTNLEMANKKYLEKAVAISGKISSTKDLDVVLDGNVICNLKEANSDVKEGDLVTVKGRVVGYDDLLGELKLDQCYITKN